jgi:hypothetical protein
MDIAQCSLAELLDDPLIGLVMKSDGVDRRELELLLEQVARGLAPGGSGVVAPRRFLGGRTVPTRGARRQFRERGMASDCGWAPLRKLAAQSTVLVGPVRHQRL